MDFNNKYFQSFIRMKDSEVKKILDRHPMSAKYFLYGGNIVERAGRIKGLSLLSNGRNMYDADAVYHQLTFDKYLELKNNHKKEFFKNLSKEHTLDYIKRRAEFYYGEENVWLNKDHNSVIIKFPEVKITNSIGSEHLMKDVFIKILVNGNSMYSIELARTSVTESEYKSRYMFSHASLSIPGVYKSSLCFGLTDLASWVSDVKKTNNFVLIDRVIASLIGYLSWESLEGNPYVYISDIGNKQFGSEAYAYNSNVESQLALKHILDKDINFKYKLIDNQDKSISIKFDEDTISKIDDLLDDCDTIVKYYRANGRSYNNIQNNQNYDNIKSNVIFKGEIVPVVIEKDENFIEPKKKVHINVLKQLVSYLEDEMLEFLIEKQNE